MFSFFASNFRWIVSGALLCFFSGFGQTFFVSLSNDTLRASLGLSHSEIGGIYAIATLASAMAISLIGGFVDRWHARQSALVPLIGLVVACALMAFAEFHVAVLLLALFSLRLFGQGLCGHVAFTAAAQWFDANRGKAVSLIGIGFSVSQAVMPALGAAGIIALGYFGMWAIAAALMLFVAAPLIYWLLLKDRTPQNHADEKSLDRPDQKSWARRDVVRCPEFYAIMVSLLCCPFMITALFFHQQHLVRLENWPVEIFLASMVPFAVIQVIAKLVIGHMIDQSDAKSMLAIYLLPLSFALMLPLLFTGAWVAPIMLLMVGTSTGIQVTLIGVLWPELFGIKNLGSIRSLVFAVTVASTAIAPVLTGYLIDIGVVFDLQLFVFGLISLLACGLMFLIQPRLKGLNSRLSA